MRRACAATPPSFAVVRRGARATCKHRRSHNVHNTHQYVDSNAITVLFEQLEGGVFGGIGILVCAMLACFVFSSDHTRPCKAHPVCCVEPGRSSSHHANAQQAGGCCARARATYELQDRRRHLSELRLLLVCCHCGSTGLKHVLVCDPYWAGKVVLVVEQGGGGGICFKKRRRRRPAAAINAAARTCSISARDSC